MTKLRRFINRARPDVKEVKMWRGILSSVEKSAKKN
jgi:tRNA (cytidine32/uridine32-2'-O)-methyltransferase